jgi:uncharacterized protein (TIGR00288 family)
MNTQPLNDLSTAHPSGKKTIPLQMTQPAETVALLIDGENMASEQIDQIIAEAGKLGNVTIRRVYGNWNELAHWNTAVSQFALEPFHTITVRPCKNGSDIALTVGAMDLFYASAIKRFCIVTTDCDYLSLILRLRRDGCQVLGIGKAETPKPLQDAYSKFISTEDLMPSLCPLSPSASILPMAPIDIVVDESTVARLLMKACLNALEAGGSNGGWVSIQRLGSELHHLLPNKLHYKKLFGKKGLANVIKEHPELFDIREQGQDRHIEVRLHTLE